MKDFEKELETVKTSEELKEELVALKLKIAFAEEFEAELAEVEEQLKNPDPELKALMEQSDDRILKLFDREQRKARVRRVVFHFVPKVAHALAIIIAICCVGLTAAVATVPPVRAGVLEFITAMEKEFIQLDTDEIDDPVQVPKEWKGEYYPTYIPEGFELEWVDGMGVRYLNGENKLLCFEEYDRDVNSNLDGKENNVERLTLRGNEAFLSEKDGRIVIAWSNGSRYFVLSGHCSEKEMIRTAEKVELIEK